MEPVFPRCSSARERYALRRKPLTSSRCTHGYFALGPFQLDTADEVDVSHNLALVFTKSYRKILINGIVVRRTRHAHCVARERTVAEGRNGDLHLSPLFLCGFNYSRAAMNGMPWISDPLPELILSTLAQRFTIIARQNLQLPKPRDPQVTGNKCDGSGRIDPLQLPLAPRQINTAFHPESMCRFTCTSTTSLEVDVSIPSPTRNLSSPSKEDMQGSLHQGFPEPGPWVGALGLSKRIPHATEHITFPASIARVSP